MSKKLDIKDVVLVGRTFDEYYKMFNLEEIDLKTKILDAASGVSSFCSEANSKGYNVIASDRIYEFSSDEIEDKCAKDLEEVAEKLKGIEELYKWDIFKNVQELRKQREIAYKGFLKDFKGSNSNKYFTVNYPKTSFKKMNLMLY